MRENHMVASPQKRPGLTLSDVCVRSRITHQRGAHSHTYCHWNNAILLSLQQFMLAVRLPRSAPPGPTSPTHPQQSLCKVVAVRQAGHVYGVNGMNIAICNIARGILKTVPIANNISLTLN